jgi:hypothetical protein
LDDVWKQAFNAVIAHGKNRSIDQIELDAMTQRMWNEVPFGEKIAFFRNVVIATSAIAAAGLLLPFDGGASLILVSKAHMVLGGAEILAMLVGGPLMGIIMASGKAGELVAKFEQEYARPQIDALYAGLADGLGIPRLLADKPQLRKNGKICHECNPSDLQLLPVKIHVLTDPLICIDEEAWNKMTTTLTSEES